MQWRVKLKRAKSRHLRRIQSNRATYNSTEQARFSFWRTDR